MNVFWRPDPQAQVSIQPFGPLDAPEKPANKYIGQEMQSTHPTEYTQARSRYSEPQSRRKQGETIHNTSQQAGTTESLSSKGGSSGNAGIRPGTDTDTKTIAEAGHIESTAE